MAKAMFSPLPRLIVLAAAGALAAPAAAPAAGFTVTFPNTVDSGPYLPGAVEAQPGDTVTFNGAFARHPLEWVHEDFTGQDTGTSRTYAFAKPGTYAFFCDFHPDMTGTVHVAGNQLATPDFAVSAAAVATGAKVTFDAGAIADPDGTVESVEWDLDGNGSFETTGTARVVSKTYAKAGTYGVGVRYVDDGHETSAATRHDVVVTDPAGGGGGGSGGGSGTGGGTGGGGSGGTGGSGGAGGSGGSGGTGGTGAGGTTTGTGPRDATAPRPALRSAKVVLKGRVASLRIRLDEAASATATLKRGSATLGKATIKRLAKGDATIKVTLDKASAAKVRKSHPLTATLTLVVRDAAGNARTLRKAVTLRR
jgi:plastocyanin